MGRSVLGIEIGARVVRAVVLTADHRVLVGAAEVAYRNDVPSSFDPVATEEAIKEVMYQLGHLVPKSLPAAVTIGPPHAGVGSGPSLPKWLEGRARFLEVDLVCSGELGLAFSPAESVDMASTACRGQGVRLERIDLAPVAAQRLLPRGAAQTFTVGSGVGWQAGARRNVVLAATSSEAIASDAPLMLIDPASGDLTAPSFKGFPVSKALSQNFSLDLAQLTPAIGAATGLIVNASGNLLDGFRVIGRPLEGAKSNRAPFQNGHADPDAAGFDDPMIQEFEAEGVELFDANLRRNMPFEVTDSMTAPETGLSEGSAAERLGGHGIAGKSSQIDAMMDSGQRLLTVMTVISIFLIAAIVLVMQLELV